HGGAMRLLLGKADREWFDAKTLISSVPPLVHSTCRCCYDPPNGFQSLAVCGTHLDADTRAASWNTICQLEMFASNQYFRNLQARLDILIDYAAQLQHPLVAGKAADKKLQSC